MRRPVLLAFSVLAGLVLLSVQQTNVHRRLNSPRLDLLCEWDSECAQFGPRYGCVKHVCSERGLFPLRSIDIEGTIGALICIIVSSGGGLGGGGLLVPLYIIVLGMTSHDAIPLSKATIFGSAIASMILNIRKKHPLDSTRQLIDYEVVMMMEPMTLAGTIIGVHMNKMFPEWLITVLLVWLLYTTSMRMVKKGRTIWKQEHEKDEKLIEFVVTKWKEFVFERKYGSAAVACAKKWKARALNKKSEVIDIPKLDQVHNNIQQDNELVGDGEEDDFLMGHGSKMTLKSGETLSLDSLMRFRTTIPWRDLTILFFAWLGLVLFSMLKGGHGTPSVIGLVCGSSMYWLLTIMSFPFFVAVTVVFGLKIAARHQVMQNYGYNYVKGDIIWTKRTTVLYPALCTVAGIAAGLLGIGGGMVKGPLLLEIGLLPQVASASSSTMILFTSSATTLQFIVLGMLPMDAALWYGIVGFVGGAIGQLGLSYLIKKYRKTAFVLFIIAGVIGASGVIMGLLGVEDIAHHGFNGFRSLCAT
ncbi:hypothetical protein THRCLA_01235 [Thraustotheca clavata]|uniref:Sulfite exporter TauE/SafE n=1 Tax=Thraustotheca clavata TaxID=74557 RepID=A0A1W0A965_9STRA|nr:hypothetical protein THRCLA_01235 [Thraustotheca clavata]